jgi:phosphate starvation-inducible PhoH-like protein
MVALLGPGDELLHLAEEQFDADVHVRGNEITIRGEADEVEASAQLFRELVELLARGQQIDRTTVRQTARMVRDSGPERARRSAPRA